MIDQDRIALTHLLELQLNDYWHEVDFNWGRGAHHYYTEDAVFEGSSSTFYEGRGMIRKFYRFREERGERTAVHAVTNFRAEQTGPDTALAMWYLLLYAADGTPPHPAKPPILLAAMTDTYKHQQDGMWLCSNRKFGALFQGGAPVTAMTTTPSSEKKS